MTSSGESDNEKESKGETVESCTATSPSQEIPETEPIQKNNDLDGNQCGNDNEKVFSPEVKSEHSNTEIESGPTGKDDTSTS